MWRVELSVLLASFRLRCRNTENLYPRYNPHVDGLARPFERLRPPPAGSFTKLAWRLRAEVPARGRETKDEMRWFTSDLQAIVPEGPLV